MTLRLVGLDGEMSSADLASGGALIQVGLAVATDTGYDVYCRTINPGEHTWDEQAAAVHGLAVDDVRTAADAADVDDEAYQWLVARGGQPGWRQLTAVGYNVASFDFPFFRAALPRTMSLFSHRAVDLNSVAMLLDGWSQHGQGRKWTTWKKHARQNATADLAAAGVPGGIHNAGWDAAEALSAYQYYRHAVVDTDRSRSRPAPDPLGDRLAARLAAAGDQVLAAARAAGFADAEDAAAWFATPRADLDGCAPGKLLADGDTDAVVAALTRAGRTVTVARPEHRGHPTGGYTLS